jgi:formylglycine-generating enzyme required for sulfatase activity
VKTPAATPAGIPAATPAPSTPAAVPATPEPMKLTLNTVPDRTMPFPKPGGSGPGNSLGMKFVPVGDVDLAIYLVRVKDFEVFAKAVNLKSNSWKSPGFVQGPDHPVVNVTWIEAIAFCTWLTTVEHKDGTLPANQMYRLPTDLEWSKAVGLADETGKTPEARDMGVPEVYPWGAGWPPPPGAGNYTGEETGSDVAIKGYDDGYAWTSPVGAFKPNKYGLYDMGGNVWQWCMDNWNNESKAKVLRGASWYNGALKLSLLSSCRVHAAPDSSTDNYGFRLVRVTDTAKPSKKPELR